VSLFVKKKLVSLLRKKNVLHKFQIILLC